MNPIKTTCIVIKNRSTAFRGMNSLIAGLLLLVSLPCCKKDKAEPKVDGPVLGTCEAVSAKGALSFSNPSGPYTILTPGGGKIVYDRQGSIIITHSNYTGFKLEYWGETSVDRLTSGNHENLNGKHIKDRINTLRSIIFPDGAKLTWIADGYAGPMTTLSYYSGAECHHINVSCGKLEYSGIDPAIAKKLDDQQADGETGSFEFTANGLLYVNLYTEDVPGTKVENRYNLGEIFRDQPNTVRDFYDDPRLAAGH